jgi:hypothetical protein
VPQEGQCPACGATIAKDRHFAESETPRYLGRAVASLAADPDVARFAGQIRATWDLSPIYGFTDVDGRQPDWGRYFDEVVRPELDAAARPARRLDLKQALPAKA